MTKHISKYYFLIVWVRTLIYLVKCYIQINTSNKTSVLINGPTLTGPCTAKTHPPVAQSPSLWHKQWATVVCFGTHHKWALAQFQMQYLPGVLPLLKSWWQGKRGGRGVLMWGGGEQGASWGRVWIPVAPTCTEFISLIFESVPFCSSDLYQLYSCIGPNRLIGHQEVYGEIKGKWLSLPLSGPLIDPQPLDSCIFINVGE